MEINEKLRILLHNREWRQKDLANRLNVEETTVQKWVSGKHQFTIPTLQELSEIFEISYEEFLNPDVEIAEYFVVDRYLPYSVALRPEEYQDSEHVLLDANLGEDAVLHRFTNAGGALCSAIYYHKEEIYWHYREKEAEMIRLWREGVLSP